MFDLGSNSPVVLVDQGWGHSSRLPAWHDFYCCSYLPWFGALESIPGVRPQLYADNLKCVSGSPAALLSAARFTNMYICLVCQKAAPKKFVFLSTSREVRSDMKYWTVSDTGDKWSVKLDIRDLGGHLDSTLRAKAVTFGFRMSAAIPRVRAVAVLPLDFVVRLRILRTMHLPASLHGAEASLVSISGLRRLRAAFCQAALSGGLRLANPGAVLSLLDGPVGSDPGFHVVWCRFRMLRRHMGIILLCMNLLGFIVFFGLSLLVLPGMVQFTCCFPVRCLLAFLGILIAAFGSGLVYLLFVRSLVLFSLFGRLFGMLGELRLLVTLVLGLVFGVVGIWIFVVL